LYVATVASRCFKSRSGVHMECAWKGDGGTGPLPGRSLIRPTHWDTRLLTEWVPSDTSVPDQTSER
jgi:hypothetical protein